MAEDVRYYGQWMRDEAEKRIGHLYPKVEITAEMARERPDLQPLVGRKLTVIAWLWARTVKSPNPAFAHVDVPLVSTFMLSTRPGKEAWVSPRVLGPDSEDGRGYVFEVKVGKPPDPEATRRGTKSRGSHSNFVCLMSGTPITFDYLRSEARAGRMGARLLAIVAEGDRGRIYLPPTQLAEAVALSLKVEFKPEIQICHWPGRTNVVEYGMTTFGDLFTPRQLVALTTFSDLVLEARERVRRDAEIAFQELGHRTQDLAHGSGPGHDTTARSYVLGPNRYTLGHRTQDSAHGSHDTARSYVLGPNRYNLDNRPLSEGGTGPAAYADAVAVYLAFAVDYASNYWSVIATPAEGFIRGTFARQALPMTWDYAEAPPFGETSGNWMAGIDWISQAINRFPTLTDGFCSQSDATAQTISSNRLVSTDPPYYDNIGYADLSDFFYVWLRRSLRPIFPELFATLAVPKAEELVATPYRHGSKEKAESFFLDGMTHAMHRLAEQAHPAFPVTIYYAFKQSETETDTATTSTGWETFLDAVIRAGFAVSGTWPMRTERGARSIGIGTNALASSIVLVCRRRPEDAPTTTRREFINALKTELPAALAHLQRSNIAPVDLQQAAIGPGMAIYTRYSRVIDAAGNPVTVRDALALINQTLDEVLAEQEADFDADTRFALAWFEQFGFAEGEFGVADVLARAKNTSVAGMMEAGILVSRAGKVRLLAPAELPAGWVPTEDTRLTVWEMVHHLIRVLDSGGESAAARLLNELGTQAETARELAYRLYTLCDRKKRAAEALAYNGLVQSWPEITRLSRERQPVQYHLPD